MSILKKIAILTLTVSTSVLLTACWESDTENAIEDVGEKVEETAEDAKDTVEDAADEIDKPE